MPDVNLNPSSLVTNGAIVSSSNPLPVSVVGFLGMYPLSAFGTLTTSAGVSAAFNAAVAYVGAAGGGVIVVPAGTYTMAVPSAFETGTNDGDACRITAGMDNIVIQGMGRGVTTLKPISNKVCMFSQNGGANLTFRGITFDNSSNGLLQNQVKPGSETPGGGVATQGNAANAAIKQWTGAGLTVEDCEFIEFNTGIGYYGNYADQSTLVGDISIDGCWFDGCVQGLICYQPNRVYFTNCDYSNGETSVNADATTDPGHGIYVSNRTGAWPLVVVVANVGGTNNKNTIVRARKANSFSCSNVAVETSHRGIDAENIRTGTVSNCAIRLTSVDASDTGASGAEFVDCGDLRVSNLSVNKEATNAYGVRIRNDLSLFAWCNFGIALDGVTITDDFSGDSNEKEGVIVTGQTDCLIKSVSQRTTGNHASTKAVVRLVTCTRGRVERPKRLTAGASSPSGSDRLVRIDSDCTGSVVEWSRQDLDVTPTTNTIEDLASDTKVLRVDGLIKGTWTPAPTFATVGDFSADNVTAYGEYVLDAEWCDVFWRLSFDCNAYTTASGSFSITGLPFTAAGANGQIDHWTAGMGSWIFTTVGGTILDVQAWVANGGTSIALRGAASNSAGGTLTTTAFPASKTGIVLRGQLRYRVVET